MAVRNLGNQSEGIEFGEDKEKSTESSRVKGKMDRAPRMN